MRKPEPTGNGLFDIFWKAYPRKEGKPKAERTFEKYCKNQETLERVLAELERQTKLKDWKHISVKFIPLAQTWLNRRDWEENHECGKSSDTESKYGYYI